jgi:hypothetical protein
MITSSMPMSGVSATPNIPQDPVGHAISPVRGYPAQGYYGNAGFENRQGAATRDIPEAMGLPLAIDTMHHNQGMQQSGRNPMIFGIGPYVSSSNGGEGSYIDGFPEDDAMVGNDLDLEMQMHYLAGGLPSHENLGNLDDLQTFLYHMQTDNFDQV